MMKTLREAAAERLESDHNDTCQSVLESDTKWPCNCGHDELRAALDLLGECDPEKALEEVWPLLVSTTSILGKIESGPGSHSLPYELKQLKIGCDLFICKYAKWVNKQREK